jgi:protein SCO1/2
MNTTPSMNEGSFDGRGRRRVFGYLLALGGAGAGAAGGTEPSHAHADHSAHQAAAAAARTLRRDVVYQVPVVTLIDQAGRKVVFNDALDDGRAVILNFIFTTCTTICPVMAQVFVQVQERLAGELAQVHMVSISIDPEFDTPARLRAYMQQQGAGPKWDFYTGSSESCIAVQKAFDAYRGSKMNHLPLTLLRGAHRKKWERFEGFASPTDIVSAYRSLAT